MAGLTADVVAVLNERAADAAARRLETRFATAGKVSADEFDKAFQAEVTKSNLGADAVGRAFHDRMARHGTQSGDTFGRSFGSQLAQSIPGISGFTSAMSGYEGAAGKMGAVAGRALGLAFTTAAAGLIGAAGYTLFKGFERYEAIDAATNRLNNLNRTMESTGRAGIDVGAVMDVVNKSVMDTPFALDQAFSVATRALASNTGDLQRFMGVVTDAAGFSGAGIDEIGEAFLKVANKGKVSMEEIGNELRNMPILPWLQDQLNVTGSELSKMISDGKVGLEDLMAAVEANAAGFAKASGDTVAGAMANAQTAVARLGANFLGALFGKPTEDGNDLVEVLKTVRTRLDEVNAWVTAHQAEIKKLFEDGVGAARDLATAVSSVMTALDKVGIGVDDVVMAFVGWKAIQGVSALTAQLGGVSTTLSTTLPAAAATGAAGISAALARVAVPLWLTTLIEDKAPNFPIQDQPTGEDRIFPGWVPLLPFWEDRIRDMTSGGAPGGPGGLPVGPSGPPSDPLGELFGLGPNRLGGSAGSQADRRGGSVGGAAPAGGDILPAPGMADGGNGPRLPAAPVVPMADLPAIAPGLQMTASLLGAQGSMQDAATKLAEKEARVNQLRADNNATADDILNAENDAARARREKGEAELRFAEAQQNAWESQTKKLDGLNSSMGELGAALDKDLGISKGLAGMADNLVRFLGSLAAAPLLGQLGAISQARGDEGSGMMGVLASTGALGSRFMPSYGASASAMGPAAFGGGMGMGGYAGDAALLSNVPAGRYAQVQNADLTQGLADCSSAVEDLVNIMDGRPTGGRSMSTHNADEWLQSHGFLPGSMPGAFNVGFNSGHMQATLPGGTPFNWGSDSSAAARGIGGTGAFDPAFTSHYYRPVGPGAPAIAPTPGAGGPGWFPGNAALGGVTGGGGQSPVFGAGPTAPAGPGIGGSVGFPMPGAPGLGQSAGLGGQAYPAGPAGGGLGMSGGLMDAAMMGTSAMDMMMPGAGAAAKVGIQLANRTIKYAGQMAGIGVSGLMQTFTPAGDNPKASIGNSWFGKIAGGLAGAAPALPNQAGGKPPGAMGGQGGQQGQAAGGGNNINQSVTVHNNHATEDMVGNQAVRELGQMYAPAGRQ